MEFKQQQLPNGLNIIGEVNSSAQSAAVGFFVRTGARDETTPINGVSHFLEHMLFKGTEKLGPIEVNEAFDSIGAQFNAFTSEENTVFYAAVLPEYLPRVSHLWMQLLRPALRESDFDMEKNVIKEEIAMYKDNPQFDVIDQCKHMYFANHPCGFRVLGTDRSIDDLTVEQMRTYFKNRYAPNNMSLVAAGNFDFCQLTDLAQQHCGNWQKQSVSRNLNQPDVAKKKHITTKKNLSCEHICLMSPAVSAQDPRRFAAGLLAAIIGDDVGSRFFWEIVDTALAEIAVVHFEPMDALGAFYSYIRCRPEKTDQVIQKVNKILQNLAETPITEQELQKAKNKALSALTLSNELPMGRLTQLGFNWVYLRQYVTVKQHIDLINAVTVADITALVDEFTPADFTQFSLRPTDQ